MSPEALRAEAEYLYRAFFRADPPPGFAERYAGAHEAWGLRETREQRAALDALVQGGLNAEALEYVLRLRDRDNFLTRKVAVVHYLAECAPDTLGDFTLREDMGLMAWAALARAAWRALWCYVAGSRTARRLGLA